MNHGNTPAAVVLAIGIALAGYLVGNALIESRTSERRVSVRGLSDREVPANVVREFLVTPLRPAGRDGIAAIGTFDKTAQRKIHAGINAGQ